MLFHLSNDSVFTVNLSASRNDGCVSFQSDLQVQSHMIRRLDRDQETRDSQLEKEYCDKLRDLMGLRLNPWSVRLRISWVPSQPHQLKVRLLNEYGPLLRHLNRLTGGGAKIVVGLTLEYKLSGQRISMGLKTKEMVITLPTTSMENLFKKRDKEYEAWCVDTVVHHDLEKILDWTDLRVTANVQFVVVDTFINEENNSAEQLMNKCKYIFAQRLNADASIVAANGTVFEFNKCFLTPHSEVLSAMFGGAFEEAKSSQVKWDNVSADCVQALLEYIYTFDLEKALNSSTVAVELFHLAHSYGIQPLEEKLMRMFLLRGVEWFDVGAALDLFSSACKIDIGVEEIKSKIVQVVKLRKEEFIKSEGFKQLSMEDWNTATDLISLALAI